MTQIGQDILNELIANTDQLDGDDLYKIGSAVMSVIGKTQLPGEVPEFGGGRIERWAAREFMGSLAYFVTGIDPDES